MIFVLKEMFSKLFNHYEKSLSTKTTLPYTYNMERCAINKLKTMLKN
jgi:hypothetical protein